jgi:virginiamycin B lyase
MGYKLGGALGGWTEAKSGEQMALTQQRSERMRPLPAAVAGLALLAGLLVLLLAIAPRTEAFVYWGDADQIGRANLDGSGADPRFIARGPYLGVDVDGVALDTAHVYWSSFREGTGTIGRASLDGSGTDPSFITGAGVPGGVAVDAAHIYWANLAASTIGRANLDGSGVDRRFITGASVPSDVAVDAAHLYWADYGSGTIGRANLDGSSADSSFITGASYPSAVAVDAAHVYWTNGFLPINTIGRANLDGSGADQSFITAAGEPLGVAVDAAHVYWSNYGTGTIGRANLDGSAADQNFITDGIHPGQIAVNFSLGKLKKDKRRGTGKLTVEVPTAGQLALTATKKLEGAGGRAEAAGAVQLPIEPQGKAKRKLAESGRAKVRVEVAYTPDGGEPSTQTTAVKLIKRG